MYRLKVKIGKRWVWGLNSYPSLEAAQERKAQMEKVGHKVKIESENVLFN
jgi:hypothetical protein